MKKQLTKLALTAALAFATTLTLSCGNHTFEELLGLDSSSSEQEDNYSSSSLKLSSSSSSLRQSGDSHPGVVVAPLLKTKWNQFSPYNDLFPIVNGSRLVTNCATTAMVQIMAFHKYPARGKGESSVLYATGGLFPVPLTSLDVAYDWDNMLGEYTTANPGNEQQRLAVATLMYHYGLARGIDGDFADFFRVLVNHFGYDKSHQELGREYYSDAEWEAIIRQQLDLGLPVYTVVSNGGLHSVVIDGYDNAGKFHINWGWGGSSDGWYSVNEPLPDNYSVAAIHINIKPDAGSIGSNQMELKEFITNKGMVSQNDEVTVTGKIHSSGFFPGGQIGVALVNNSGNIVAVRGAKNFGTLFKATSSFTIKFSPSDVKAGQYNLRIVTKMNGETDWKIVTAALQNVPKSIPFTVTTSCTDIKPDANSIISGTLTDSRDGKKYKTIKINEQTWMAENLNYNIAGGKCYGEGGKTAVNDNLVTLSPAEIQANCEKYGRLYDWETATKACPGGWHLPDSYEWDKLLYYVDGKCAESPYESKTAGKYLKAQSGWNDYKGKSSNGTDNFGFYALPSGKASNFNASDGIWTAFSYAGEQSYWWTSSEWQQHSAYHRSIDYDEWVYFGTSGKNSSFYSVRCVKD